MTRYNVSKLKRTVDCMIECIDSDINQLVWMQKNAVRRFKFLGLWIDGALRSDGSGGSRAQTGSSSMQIWKRNTLSRSWMVFFVRSAYKSEHAKVSQVLYNRAHSNEQNCRLSLNSKLPHINCEKFVNHKPHSRNQRWQNALFCARKDYPPILFLFVS